MGTHHKSTSPLRGVALLILFLIGFSLLLWSQTRGHTIAILQPHGMIADREKSILAFAFFLSMVVIIPVYILTVYIIWKYRADNTAAKYQPDWDRSRRLETIWWGIPFFIIMILSVVTWQTSHSLDPFKPIAGDRPPMTIQVVALQWKWLFIYPDQHIATVNYFRMPVNTPVDFQVTADAPMNSFWIPQLGGQIYAMPGMSTDLHLVASTAGSYHGSSANISGRGFSGMNFMAEAISPHDFSTWVQHTSHMPQILDATEYAKLADAHTNVERQTYGHVDGNPYDTIVMQYMSPNTPETNTNTVSSGEGSYAR